MLTTGGKILLLVLMGITVCAFGRRAKFLIDLLKLGQPEDRFDKRWARLKYLLGQVLPQRCVLKNVTQKDRSGLGHMLLFYGFCLFGAFGFEYSCYTFGIVLIHLASECIDKKFNFS